MKTIRVLTGALILITIFSIGCGKKFNSYYYLYENRNAVLLTNGNWYLQTDIRYDDYGKPSSADGDFSLVKVISIRKQKGKFLIQVEIHIKSLTFIPNSLCDIEDSLYSSNTIDSVEFRIAPDKIPNQNFLFIPLDSCYR